MCASSIFPLAPTRALAWMSPPPGRRGEFSSHCCQGGTKKTYLLFRAAGATNIGFLNKATIETTFVNVHTLSRPSGMYTRCHAPRILAFGITKPLETTFGNVHTLQRPLRMVPAKKKKGRTCTNLATPLADGASLPAHETGRGCLTRILKTQCHGKRDLL